MSTCNARQLGRLAGQETIKVLYNGLYPSITAVICLGKAIAKQGRGQQRPEILVFTYQLHDSFFFSGCLFRRNWKDFSHQNKQL